MKKKSFIGKFYYIGGTILLAVMVVIVSVNIVRDSRLFEKPVVAVSKDKTVKPVQTLKPDLGKKSDSSGSKDSSGKDSGKNADKLMVEVVNYTGDEKVGETIKSTLEANGFVVVLKNDTSTRDETVIVERTDKKAGEKVQSILKAGKLSVEIQAEPYFDAIIQVGTDYLP